MIANRRETHDRLRPTLVSVGIPTYNRPEGLRRTLGCIVNQTYRNLEIIVSDNRSAGRETEEVVGEFQRRDPRIVVYKQPRNLGMYENLKFVLERATGEFFFWAADDDEWDPEFVAVCLAQIGKAGSVMTGLRTAVRPMGLLRPNPAVPIRADQSPFDNAVAFLSTSQPSLFYGIHRTTTVRRFLTDPAFDYFDIYLVLRQILDHGFHVVPRMCFTAGIDSLTSVTKSLRPRPGAAYEYWPFVRHAGGLIATNRNLNLIQRLRLLFLTGYWVVNWFAHAEHAQRPAKARLAAWMTACLATLTPLFRVPLPLPPHLMFLPTDPAGVCYRFVPPEQLETGDSLRKHIEAALAELRAKEAVCSDLRHALDHRLPWGAARRLVRALSSRDPGSPSRGESAGGAISRDERRAEDQGHDVDALRHELGLLFLKLETKEREIQALARTYARVGQILRLPAIAVAGARRLGRRLVGT